MPRKKLSDALHGQPDTPQAPRPLHPNFIRIPPKSVLYQQLEASLTLAQTDPPPPHSSTGTVQYVQTPPGAGINPEVPEAIFADPNPVEWTGFPKVAPAAVCHRCGQLALHADWPVEGGPLTKWCCRCWIQAGYQPWLHHPGCVAAHLEKYPPTVKEAQIEPNFIYPPVSQEPTVAPIQVEPFPNAGPWPRGEGFAETILGRVLATELKEEVRHEPIATRPGQEVVTLDQIQALLPFGYLAGAAGSGKTYLARELVKSLGDRGVMCATTGIAAVNLGDATTVNSLFGYYDTNSLKEQYASGFLAYRMRMLRKSGIRTVVADEVSMMDADQLDILCASMDDIDLKKSYDRDLEEVEIAADDDFRLRLLLVGDFCQLPPIDGPYAFESGAWSRFQVLKLEKMWRQTEPGFIEALQAVRRGDGAAALDVLRPCFTEKLDLQFDGATLVAKNDSVDRINALRAMKLSGPEYTWKTQRSGDQQKEWVKHIPEEFRVRKGALVMVLANKPYPKLDPQEMTQFAYVNGDLGTVLEQTPEGIKVFLHRTFDEKVITPNLKEWKEATGKRNPRWLIKGAVTYMPLRMAYASTTHKSQGLTMDKVQVSISDGMFMKPSMLYVALSRARSLEGLRIVGTERQFLGRCGVAEKVRGWL